MERIIESNLLIEKMIGSLGELPSSPKIIASVMRLTADPDADITQMEQIISADQSLVVKLLKLSNSTFYGQRKSVSTVKQAIIIIGLYTLRTLVLAASIHNLYANRKKNSLESKLWEHSLSTAIASRMLAKNIGHGQVEEAFLGGLLHDIGKLVMIQKLGYRYEDICSRIEARHLPFRVVEEQTLGFTHCDVGMMLLSKWNLPQDIINAVFMHHMPHGEEIQPIGDASLTQVPIEFILELGNQVAKQTGHGFDDFREENLSELSLAKAMSLSLEAIQELTDQVEAEYLLELKLFEGS